MVESGIEARDVDAVKGRGVVTSREFAKGEFVTTYQGEIITGVKALEREKEYSKDDSIGSYLFFFKHKSAKLWYVDN